MTQNPVPVTRRPPETLAGRAGAVTEAPTFPAYKLWANSWRGGSCPVTMETEAAILGLCGVHLLAFLPLSPMNLGQRDLFSSQNGLPCSVRGAFTARGTSQPTVPLCA